MKWHICITLDECYEVDVEADTQEEAEDIAFEKFENQEKTYAIESRPIALEKTTYRLAK